LDIILYHLPPFTTINGFLCSFYVFEKIDTTNIFIVYTLKHRTSFAWYIISVYTAKTEQTNIKKRSNNTMCIIIKVCMTWWYTVTGLILCSTSRQKA